MFWSFGFISLGFVSDFDIRISDLKERKHHFINIQTGGELK